MTLISPCAHCNWRFSVSSVKGAKPLLKKLCGIEPPWCCLPSPHNSLWVQKSACLVQSMPYLSPRRQPPGSLCQNWGQQSPAESEESAIDPKVPRRVAFRLTRGRSGSLLWLPVRCGAYGVCWRSSVNCTENADVRALIRC